MPKQPQVDIVVVVRDQPEAVEACLASVREHTGSHRVIPVDAGAVDRVLAAGDADVVVLEPNVRVTRGWLDKLIRCANSDPRIGIVTPFADAVPHLGSPELVHRAVELAAVPLYPDAPGVAQSCMYIRRRLLRDVAGFGADFAARAREAGFRTVLCDDAHVSSIGFVDVDRGAQNDALAPVRTMIRSQLAVLEGEGRPGVLHVVHPRGGGTEKYIRELIAGSRDEYRHYFLRILPDRWRLTDADDAVPGAYEWPRDGDRADWLRAMCAWLRIGVAHVHSLVGSGDELPRILARAAVPYCYSVHDMYLPCPTVYLINSEGAYCNATTDLSLCRQCLSKFAGLEHVDIERWRTRYGGFLAKAARVYAPSTWAGDTLAKYYPGTAVTLAPPRVEPHPSEGHEISDALSLPDDGHRHIGMLGAIGPEKGARLLEAMVARIRQRDLPLRIVVVGYTDRESRWQAADKVLTVHGSYRREEIEALFDHYRIALLAFPTIWPETFSYTLSEGWMAGRAALVPPRGALRERVQATGAGWLMEGFPDVDAMLDQLLVLTAPENRGDLEAKSRLARAVFRDHPQPAMDLYRGLAVDVPEKAAAAVARYPIYEAACRALAIEPLPAPALVEPAEPVPRRTPLSRLVRLLRD